MDFEELEYELFEFLTVIFLFPISTNPVGIAAQLISEVEEMDAKTLFEMGKEAVMSKEK